MKVKSDDQEKKEEFIVQMIQRVMRDYVEGKIVMYCNSVRKMKELTKALNCESYYHHAKQKDEKLKRFQDDEKRVIVTTSALRLRIDILDIRAIIHVDESRSLMNYAQKSERAKRDELSSQAIVRWKEDDREVKSAKEWRIEEMRWMTRFIKSDENDTKASCRRVMLNEYLNERENRRECEDGKEKCDVCNKMMRLNEKKIVKNAIQKKKRRSSMQNERELNLMKRQKYDSQQHERLSIWVERNERKWEKSKKAKELLWELKQMKELCSMCTKNESDSNVHLIYYCRESTKTVEKYQSMKKLIRERRTMKKFEDCNWCFVSQTWCNRWEENESEEKEWRLKARETKCKYMNMMLGWFLIFVQDESFAEKLQDRMRKRELNMNDQKEILRYLRRRKKWEKLKTWKILEEYWQEVKERKKRLES